MGANSNGSILLGMAIAWMFAAPNIATTEPVTSKEGSSPMQPVPTKIHRVVYVEGRGFLAFDRADHILFEVFPFDNGPDYPCEGLFRILEDGKVGYADESGRVTIAPRFSAALPFSSGMAGFCEGCSTRKARWCAT